MLSIAAPLLGVVALAVVLAAATVALAVPRIGDKLPDVKGKDLAGDRRALSDLLGDPPVLLIAITERSSDKAMQAWFDKSDTLAPRMIRRIAVVSLELPFFISDGMARAEARGKTPKEFFGRMMIDTDGTLAKGLGLGKGEKPHAFVLDGEGRVIAAYRGHVDDPGAAAIWKAWPGR